MKLRTFVCFILLLSVLVACGNNTSTSDREIDIKQVVQSYSLKTAEAESASITSDLLIISELDDSETTYDITNEDFFISIAPYVNETHPCRNHSLTGCQGELVEESFQLKIENMDGELVVDETMESMKNGFIDLWLPRNETFKVTITHDGKSAEEVITTNQDDPTCITTMQLL
ncbi:CueP family metal-binding protein [Alkalihalobacillus pseudalcaliphilus]|uniref:CueP family metal-binding protein n=1 Tax=Alkalihalobacillus pseudalcaliphilus TaxID=79884 RepID=UPI00064E1271|nr:CueP family metal-binding protein [Alkalihalobacillus pseudalcaliphilus]KMK76345.1 hypothetical protein AB990_14180 [Alkalihalobacillus pseudalcaliphilus]